MVVKRSLIHRMKTGDLRPYLQVKIFNPDGTPRDISGDILTFNMKHSDGTLVLNGELMTPVTPLQGITEYRWQEGETDEAGVFRGEVIINGIDTYPKDGYITIEFKEDLD